MQYYPAGKIVKEVWQSIPDHFPHVTVDHFVIMPNHIHGIINIVGARPVFDASTRCAVPLPIIEQFGKPVARSIPTIIRSFKSEVTRQVNLLQHTPGAKLWQRNYYEHVIRNEEEYETIYEYMLANPQNWEEDKLNR